MMASCTHKFYHEHGFDPREHLEHYMSAKPERTFEEDILTFPMENLAKTFSMGHINGDILIDLSAGSMIQQLYAACEFFKHIIVLKVRDRCIMEMKRWLDSRTGAFDWGHCTKLHGKIQGIGDQLQEKEGQIRSTIPQVMKCNLNKENMTDPIVLSPADCIISVWFLDNVCKDQDDYTRYLGKFSGMLKPGGHLILLGGVGMTYYTVGKDKYHVFTYDEDFAKKALAGTGFVIDEFKVKKKTAASDLADYEASIFIVAHREK